MVSTLHSDWRIISIAANRSTAPVEVREQLSTQNWVALLETSIVTLREWAIVSTCHRFELYAVTTCDQVTSLILQLQALLSDVLADLDLDEVEYQLPDGQALWTVKTDEDAAEHLCRVAAGLDSLVLGEAQIQGQVIATYTRALAAGTVGPALSSLFRTAIRVGKRARTETHISTRAVSMSSVALNMAAHHLPDFSQARVLIIGAGEMSRLALKALLQRQIGDVTVTNRTRSRAEAALMHPKWQLLDFDQLSTSLHQFDIIFSATSAPGFVLKREHFARNHTSENSAPPQVLIDLAVPRDIDPSIRELPGMSLIDVDDLRNGLDESLAARIDAMPAVTEIINDEIVNWQAEQRELAMRPYVVELRQRAERIRQEEVERTMRFMGPVDDETHAHIQHLSHALVNKLLHEPTIRIKELAHEDEADTYVSAICDIFGLELGPPIQQEVDNAIHLGEPSRS